MKPHQIVAIGVIVLNVAAAARATAADRTRPADVRFVSSQRGEVVIPVFVGGKGPYRFLLDTGASHTLISPSLATALAPSLWRRRQWRHPSGLSWRWSFARPTWPWGPLASNRRATFAAVAAAGMLGEGISGVLDRTSLALDYTLDYQNPG